jgi:ubiquinone/menaquinone biosynthesis C-methylase UbiE
VLGNGSEYQMQVMDRISGFLIEQLKPLSCHSLILELASGASPQAYIPLSVVRRQVVALDVSSGMLKFNLAKCRIQADMRFGLPINENSVDLVQMVFGFRYIEPQFQDGFVTEVFRVLKPGGKVVLVDLTNNGHKLEVSPFDDVNVCEMMSRSGFTFIRSKLLMPMKAWHELGKDSVQRVISPDIIGMVAQKPYLLRRDFDETWS